MSDKAKQIHALQLLFLLIPDSHYQLLKDTLFLLHSTAAEVKIFPVRWQLSPGHFWAMCLYLTTIHDSNQIHELCKENN